MENTTYGKTEQHLQNHEFFFNFFHKVKKQNPKMHANHFIWGKEITLPETCFLLLLYKASNAKKKKKIVENTLYGKIKMLD